MRAACGGINLSPGALDGSHQNHQDRGLCSLKMFKTALKPSYKKMLMSLHGCMRICQASTRM